MPRPFERHFNKCERTKMQVRIAPHVDAYWPPANSEPLFYVKTHSSTGWMKPDEAATVAAQLAAAVHAYRQEQKDA